MVGDPTWPQLHVNHAGLSLGDDGPGNHLMRSSSTTLPAKYGLCRNRCCRDFAESKSTRSNIVMFGTLSASACSMNLTASSPRLFSPYGGFVIKSDTPAGTMVVARKFVSVPIASKPLIRNTATSLPTPQQGSQIRPTGAVRRVASSARIGHALVA